MDEPDEERVQEESWTGSERQRHERGGCLPPTNPPLKRAAYTVPVGVKCLIKRTTANDWRQYTTTKELSFERFESYRGQRYEFRLKGWLMLVGRQYVIHREDTYPPGV